MTRQSVKRTKVKGVGVGGPKCPCCQWGTKKDTREMINRYIRRALMKQFIMDELRELKDEESENDNSRKPAYPKSKQEKRRK